MHQTDKFLSIEEIDAYEAHSNISAPKFKVLKLGIMPKLVHETKISSQLRGVVMRNVELRSRQIGEEICNYIIISNFFR